MEPNLLLFLANDLSVSNPLKNKPRPACFFFFDLLFPSPSCPSSSSSDDSELEKLWARGTYAGSSSPSEELSEEEDDDDESDGSSNDLECLFSPVVSSSFKSDSFRSADITCRHHVHLNVVVVEMLAALGLLVVGCWMGISVSWERQADLVSSNHAGKWKHDVLDRSLYRTGMQSSNSNNSGSIANRQSYRI